MSHPKAQAVDPLSSLTRISPSVYLYDVVDSVVSRQETGSYEETNVALSSVAPRMIVLFTWMSAHPVHIFKYISGYRTLYPNSRILIIRSSPADIIWRSGSTQRRRIDPAVSAILSHSNAAEDSAPEILLHLFSNGGSSQLLPLLYAYREQMSESFPPHIKILDSCPGRGNFTEAIDSLSHSLPKSQPLHTIFLVLLYLLTGAYFTILISFGVTNPIEHIRQALNDTESVKNERARCYIYGDADRMVCWRDVEAHVEDARQKGLTVRTERFEGSGHVAHIRQGGGVRYWNIIDEMWRGAKGKHKEAGGS